MNELTLREIRLKLGMTVREMAEELNVPKSSYSYWESRNRTPEGAMQKVNELYDNAKEHMIDDGIDIVEKIGTIKRHYNLSYDSVAHLVGAKQGSSAYNWLNGVQPRVKYMIRINELYYKIVDKKRKAKTGGRPTFCQINPLDRQSWKVKMENQVIVWK
jgi:DNA-binding XRE family transcriptional regulator